MIALVHLSPPALTDPASLAALADLARGHQLVLVCARCSPARPVIAGLRRALSGRELVAVLTDGEVPAPERRLVEQLLREGTVPLILTGDAPAAARLVNWFWLAVDRVLTLPAEPGTG
jgi:hypothetical protein